MKKYQVLTVVHSNFSIRIVPDPHIYANKQDAEEHIYNMFIVFVEQGEICQYKGYIKSTNDIFDIYAQISDGEYTEAYILELEEK